MAAHAVTRVLIVSHGDKAEVEGILSLRHLLEARRIDLHEEHHMERIFTLRSRARNAAAKIPALSADPPSPADHSRSLSPAG
jgi:hypothetical protein